MITLMNHNNLHFICRKAFLRILLAALLLSVRGFSASCAAQLRDNAKWVNPMIGTAISDAPTLWGNYGGTYPGAVSPWGMLQLSPETSRRPSERGYYYSDNAILKFTCMNHWSGYPNGSAGRLAVMFMRGTCVNVPSSYSGRAFSHADEEAVPGYYGVRFNDGDRVEMTAATHSGIMNYSTSCPTATVVVCQAGKVSVASPSEVRCDAGHAVLSFSRPMTGYTLRGDTLYAHFATPEALEVRLSVSATDFEQSKKNGAAQLAGSTFASVRRAAYAHWQKELACVDINGAAESVMQKFYTALYHAMLMPCNVADVGSKPRYAGFSPWDTFRTLHPLLALIKPEVQADIVDAMMETYGGDKAWQKEAMTGFHAVPILLDSYMKGVARHSAADIYRTCLRLYDAASHDEALQEYRRTGYVGARHACSVSLTAELAYDDWAMMRLCQLRGDTASAHRYASAALGYAKLWDAQTLFMLPRDGDRVLRHSGELGYQESNKWTASLFAPHNVRHLVHLSGGDECFSDRLRQAFDNGNIVFDNEPVLHYPWLYVWSRRPDLTLNRVQAIAGKCYGAAPGGIPGNDDLGSMSSWLAFSVMGLMPVCPGTDEYVILPPMAEEVVIHLSGGKTMRIEGGGRQKYAAFPLPKLNGKVLNRCHITHAELVGGGTLQFDSCAALDASRMQLPYSFSAGEPQFCVKMGRTAARRTRPDKDLLLPFTVSNGGAEGVCRVVLTSDGDTVASKNVFVAAGSSVADTLVCRLYAEGRHTLRLANDVVGVTVEKAAKGSAHLSCTGISVCPVAKRGEQLAATVRVKNVSGRTCEEKVALNVDGKAVSAVGVRLLPGEERDCRFTVPAVYADGMHTMSVLGKAEKVKVCSDAVAATVLDVDFPEGKAADKSGFGNDGRCFGALKWSLGTLTTAQNAYVEFPASASLMHPYQRFTMLTWVRPSRNDGAEYVDFFTKGDYTLMKLQGGNRLGFFAGGWGRGECEVPVPDDWEGRWHLLAGVCSEGSIKIYIDGELKQTIAVQGTVAESEMQWNLGRNAEMPFSRFGNLTFKSVRIYAAALDDGMIRRIYHEEKPEP